MDHLLTTNTNWDTLSPSPGDNIFLNGFALNLVGGTGVHSNQFDLGSGTISATSDGTTLTEGSITSDYTAFCVYDDAVLTANLRSGLPSTLNITYALFTPIYGSTLTINGNITAAETNALEIGPITIKINGTITGGSSKVYRSIAGIYSTGGSSMDSIDLSGSTIIGGSGYQCSGAYFSGSRVNLTNVTAIGGDASNGIMTSSDWTGAVLLAKGGTGGSNSSGILITDSGGGETYAITTAQGGEGLTGGCGVYQAMIGFTGTITITNCIGGDSKSANGCIAFSTSVATFNVDTATGGSVAGAYGFYNYGTNTPTITNSIDNAGLAYYKKQLITIAANTNWFTGGVPCCNPGDDITINSGYVLTLNSPDDIVTTGIYTCHYINGPGNLAIGTSPVAMIDVTINASLLPTTSTTMLTVIDQTVTINGNVTGGSTANYAIRKTGVGIITINGMVSSGTAGGAYAISLENATGLFTVNNGTCLALSGSSSTAPPIGLTAATPMMIIGNISSQTSSALIISQPSNVTIIGNIVYASVTNTSPTLSITAAATVSLTGNIYANSYRYGCSITAGANFTCNGTIKAASNFNFSSPGASTNPAGLFLDSSSAVIDLTNCNIAGGSGTLSYGVYVSSVSSINLTGTTITGGSGLKSHGIYYNSTTAWTGSILSVTGGTNSASGIYIDSAIVGPISITTARGNAGVTGLLSSGEIRQPVGGPGVYQASTSFDNTLTITNCYGGNSNYAFGCIARTTSVATFNIDISKGGTVTDAYGFYNCGTTTPTITNPDESGVALYYNKALLLSGSLSWSSCNGGNPPAITDDLILTAGCTLQLDNASEEYVYQCSSITGPGYLTFGSSSTVIITANLLPTTTNSMLAVVDQTVTINGNVTAGVASYIHGIRKTGVGIITVNGKLIGSCNTTGNTIGVTNAYAASLENDTGLFTVNAGLGNTALIGNTSTPIKLWAETPISITGNILGSNSSTGGYGLYINRDNAVTISGNINGMTAYGLYVNSELATLDLTDCTISYSYFTILNSINLTNSIIVANKFGDGAAFFYGSEINLTNSTIIGIKTSASGTRYGVSIPSTFIGSVDLSGTIITGGLAFLSDGLIYAKATTWTGTVLSTTGQFSNGILCSSTTGSISINTAQGGTNGFGFYSIATNANTITITNCYGGFRGGIVNTSQFLGGGCRVGSSTTVNITNLKGGNASGLNGLIGTYIPTAVSIANFDSSGIASPFGFGYYNVYKIPTTSHLVFKDNSNNLLNAYGEGTLPVNSDVKKNTVYAISNVGTLNTNYAY